MTCLEVVPEPFSRVWTALRVSLRSVFEEVSLANVVTGDLRNRSKYSRERLRPGFTVETREKQDSPDHSK